MKRAQDNLSPLFIVLSLCCGSTVNPSAACLSRLEFYTNVLQVFSAQSCCIHQQKTRAALTRSQSLATVFLPYHVPDSLILARRTELVKDGVR